MVKDHSDSEKGNLLPPHRCVRARVCVFVFMFMDECIRLCIYTCRCGRLHVGATCSSVVRAFAHGAMGRRIDPSWWTH